MRVMDREKFLKAIDNMDIYSKDYITITNLMDALDDSLFVKILEEVLNGNLFWSDFESIFDNSSYSDILRENIPLQKKLTRDISALSELRRQLGFNPSYSENNIGIVGSYFDNYEDLYNEYKKLEKLDGLKIKPLEEITVSYLEDLKNNDIINKTPGAISIIESLIEYKDMQEKSEFYRREYENMRDNILYSLSTINPRDSVLTQECKRKLYNAFSNYKMLSNCTIEENGKIYYNDALIGKLEDNKITVDGVDHQFISPDDIILSIDQGIIPIGYSYQTLNSVDLEFMRKHKLTEDSVKQMKSLSEFLRREYFLNRGGN